MTNQEIDSISKEDCKKFQQDLNNAFEKPREKFQRIKKNINAMHALALVGLASIPLCMGENAMQEKSLYAIAFIGLIASNELRKKERQAYLSAEAVDKTLDNTSNLIVSNQTKNLITKTISETYQTNKKITLINLLGSGTAVFAYLTGNLSFETGAAVFSAINTLTEGYSLSLNKNTNRVIRASLPSMIMIPDITKRVKE